MRGPWIGEYEGSTGARDPWVGGVRVLWGLRMRYLWDRGTMGRWGEGL